MLQNIHRFLVFMILYSASSYGMEIPRDKPNELKELVENLHRLPDELLEKIFFSGLDRATFEETINYFKYHALKFVEIYRATGTQQAPIDTYRAHRFIYDQIINQFLRKFARHILLPTDFPPATQRVIVACRLNAYTWLRLLCASEPHALRIIENCLKAAVIHSNVEYTKFFLRSGISPNIRLTNEDVLKFSERLLCPGDPLILASLKCLPSRAALEIIKFSPHINLPVNGDNKNRLIHLAAQFTDATKSENNNSNMRERMIRFLHRNGGADVDARNAMGETALIVAIQNRYERTAMLLLKLGADPRLRNEAGESAIDILEASGRRNTEQEIYLYKAIENRLRELGAQGTR